MMTLEEDIVDRFERYSETRDLSPDTLTRSYQTADVIERLYSTGSDLGISEDRLRQFRGTLDERLDLALETVREELFDPEGSVVRTYVPSAGEPDLFCYSSKVGDQFKFDRVWGLIGTMEEAGRSEEEITEFRQEMIDKARSYIDRKEETGKSPSDQDKSEGSKYFTDVIQIMRTELEKLECEIK